MKVVAKSRELQGTSASRRLRLAGKVPGIIYGGEAGAKSIEMEHNPLYHAMRVESFHSSILDVEVDGKSEQVLLRDVHWHPWKRQVMHVDFQRVQANEKITLSVPLHFINEEVSPAVKLEAAIISHVITELDIVCLPKDLPEYVEVDMSEMTTDHAVHVSDLKLPAGVETDYLEGADPVVATATVKAGADVEQEDGAPQAPAAPEVPGADDEAPKEEE
ncbi:MAG: 50S ribosomal protein L25/general stress protein Ctc [Burkholderiaceae bacterium]